MKGRVNCSGEFGKLVEQFAHRSIFFRTQTSPLKYSCVDKSELGKLQTEKAHLGVPGPGRYEIKSQFQKTQSLAANITDESSFFLSESERFAPIKSSTPAPGTYNETRTAFKCSEKRSGEESPFGQSAARFTEDFEAQEMPGSLFIFYSNYMQIIVLNRPFLSLEPPNSMTFLTFFLYEADRQNDGIVDKLPNLIKRHTAFLSRKQKTTEVPPQMFPAPGSYEVQKSYDMSQVKHNYMPPRSSVAKKKHSSFLSTSPRPRCLGRISEGPVFINPPFTG
ncbi:sperm-tail PG-rich repeat-containing protein 2 [Cricetulus griseus]|nr:sperm-tail PG-rich repeat-containing protein 2 [Cricetulus griseus]